MALKDILTEPPKRPTQRSRVDVWRDALDEADREAFDAAVRNPAWSVRALVDVVAAEGLEISAPGFQHWRGGALRRSA